MRVSFPNKLRFLFTNSRYKILHGGRGGAKCLALGTKVIMFDGTLKAVEDVQDGDLVMGPDSTPRTVLSTTRGSGPLYRVKQTSGMEYVVNEEHILSLKKSTSCKRDVRLMPSGNPRSPRGRYPEWDDVTNLPVTDFLRQSARWQSHFMGYRAGVIQFEKQPVDIDPYLLGIWLGDGTSRELRITSADDEVIAYCQLHAAVQGGTCSISAKPDQQAKDIGLCVRKGRLNLLWEPFKRYGLKGNKHIPQVYLSNAEDVRLSLLAGLLDSDGHRRQAGYTIVQVNERLARDIKFLADGLGFRTHLAKRRTICRNNGVIGEAWSLSINGDTWRIPCRVKRKQIARLDVRKNKNFLLSQVSVAPVGEGAWAGFALDGDHLFLLEDGTVTHNSWGIARALLLLAANQPLRILCCREVQKSLKESVHQLLCDQIKLLGLEDQYDILETEIRGKHVDSLFIYTGLQDHTSTSMKSYEGINVCWIEEAQSIKKKSIQILVPTIRKDGSEIWVSMNPDLDTDYSYKYFIVNPPPGAQVVAMNWSDNPWLPQVLEDERVHMLKNDPEEYLNIWEGEPRVAVAGAIYAKEVAKLIKDNRYTLVPYDPRLKVHTVWDLGWNDATAILLVQRQLSECRIIGYLEGSFRRVDEWAKVLNDMPYNWGWDYLPHDGYDHERKTGLSDYDILKKNKRRVKPEMQSVPNVDEEQGIRAARQLLARTYIHKDGEGCDRVVEVLKRFRRNIPKATNEPAKPMHDEFSHGAAAIRYLALVVDKLSNDEDVPKGPDIHGYHSSDQMLGVLG